MENNNMNDFADLDDSAFINHNPSDLPKDVVPEEPNPKEQEPPTPTPTESSPTPPPTPNEEVPTEPSISFPDDFDYKEAYTSLYKPFKAGGKQVSVKDNDEIIRLMQMGIGYNDKSRKLNEQVRLATTLTNAGIDETALGFLIDVHNKKPEAIHKLLKDSNTDVLDIDLTTETYTPTPKTVSLQEVQFASALEDVVANYTKGTEFLTVVNSTWDDNSKTSLMESTDVLPVLAEHYESGVYKIITDEMQRLRLVGNLQNVSFMDAYLQVGNAMLQQQQSTTNATQTTQTSQQPIARRIATKSTQPAVAAQKAAQAALPRSTQTATPNKFENLHSLSDEDFMKLSI